MGTNSYCYTEEDVTTVYDALRTCTGNDIAQSLLAPEDGRAVNTTAPSNVVRLAARRVESMVKVLDALGPNYEASSEILLPWKASHASLLKGRSWPDVLGMRIAFPSRAGRAQRHRLLANVLLSMSYV